MQIKFLIYKVLHRLHTHNCTVVEAQADTREEAEMYIQNSLIAFPQNAYFIQEAFVANA